MQASTLFGPRKAPSESDETWAGFETDMCAMARCL